MREFMNLMEHLDVTFISEVEEYDGQNEFIKKMRANPKFIQRCVRAIERMKARLLGLPPGRFRHDFALQNVINNYPNSDASLDDIKSRIGSPDWDECDHDEDAAVEFALKILDDAIEHPVDWDCIAGIAIRALLK